jgi:molecular chaperone GrpE (heat shock protein)
VEAEARLAELDAALVATREELERVSAERDAHKELLQRVAADFDNFRKRQVREREQQALAANERLVLDLLPVFDALELAVDAFDNHEADKVREGVAYVHRATPTARCSTPPSTRRCSLSPTPRSTRASSCRCTSVASGSATG